MKLTVYFAAMAALATSFDASAVGSLARIVVIDRRTGAELNPYFHHGEYWVAGAPGARYSIEIRNCLGERLLAVTSIDGVNVISGASAAWDQAGYVFDPGETYQIAGWRKNNAEVAAFTFTDSPNSYAARTGRPANIGVIGVALFRERTAPQVYAPPVVGEAGRLPEAGHTNSSAPEPTAIPTPGSAADSGAADSGAAARAAAPATSPQASSSSERRESQPSARAQAPRAKLGTGHGEREYSYVNQTQFARMQPQPNEIIRIRYDSYDNLVAMGIIALPHPTLPTPEPFPGSPARQYVPDPPAGGK